LYTDFISDQKSSLQVKHIHSHKHAIYGACYTIFEMVHKYADCSLGYVLNCKGLYE